jgi:WD40 repeat protein
VVAEQAEALCRSREATWFAVDPRRGRPEEDEGCIRTLNQSAKAVALDAAGRVAVTVGEHSQDVHFWDLGTGEPLRIAAGHHDAVVRVAMTPDGQKAVTGGGTVSWCVTPGTRDGIVVVAPLVSSTTGRPMAITPDYSLRVWDVPSGECVATLHGHTDAIKALAVSADGDIAVSASDDRTLRLWDARKGACLCIVRNYLEPIRTLSLDAAAGTCVAVCGKGRIHVWDVRAGNWRFLRPPLGEQFQAATVAPDGRTVYAITDRTLFVWPTAAQTPLCAYPAPEKLTSALAVAPAASIAVTAGEKTHALMIWPLGGPESRPRQIAGAGNCECVAVTPDARYALSAASDVRFWDLTASRVASEDAAAAPLEPLETATADDGKKASKAEFLEWGKTLATVDGEGHLDLCDPQTGARRRRLDTAGHKTTLLAAAREADVLLTAGDDRAIRIWSSDADGCKQVFRDHKYDVAFLAVTADGNLAASASGGFLSDPKENDDRVVRVWDVRSGRHLHTLGGIACKVVDLAFDPHGGAVVAVDLGDLAGLIHFWDGELCLRYGRQLISPMSLHGGFGSLARNLALAPDGATIALGGFNNETKGVQIFNFRTGLLYRLPAADRIFSHVAFVRNGRAVIAKTWGTRQINVWDCATSELMATCLSAPDVGNGDFRWVDEAGCCVCPNGAGGSTTLTIHNLPPRELSLDAATADLASANLCRRLTGLWYAIDRPKVACSSEDGADRFYSAILDNVCLADEGLEAAGVRHAAVRAALRAGPGILRRTLDRMACERSWQAVGSLALVLGRLDGAADFPEVHQALCRAAEHPDVRARKRVAVVLPRCDGPWAGQLLQQMRRTDSTIDELLTLVETGLASGAALDRVEGNLDLRDEKLATALCPSSDSDMKESKQLFGQDIKAYGQQGHRTLLGGSHPYLEWVFLKRRLDAAIAAENYKAAAAISDEVFYLDRAHDLEGDFSKDTRSLLDRLADLKCIAEPVKRVVAGLLRNHPDDKQAEKIQEVCRCVEFVEEFEAFEDFQFRELCDQLDDVTEPKDLFRELGVGAAAAEMSLGLGAPEWLAYAHVVMHDQAKLLYCLANQHVQVFPNNDAVRLIAEVFNSLGYPLAASGLREQFLGADDPQDRDRKNTRDNDLGDEDDPPP